MTVELDFHENVELVYVHLEELALQAFRFESYPLTLEETVEQLVIADLLEDLDECPFHYIVVELELQLRRFC